MLTYNSGALYHNQYSKPFVSHLSVMAELILCPLLLKVVLYSGETRHVMIS